MKHSSFDSTILALDAETSAFGAVTSAIARRSFDVTISALGAETSALDAETSALGAATSAIARVTGDISDCGVSITLQLCNRVTNHGDMRTFSKPGSELLKVVEDLVRATERSGSLAPVMESGRKHYFCQKSGLEKIPISV